MSVCAFDSICEYITRSATLRNYCLFDIDINRCSTNVIRNYFVESHFGPPEKTGIPIVVTEITPWMCVVEMVRYVDVTARSKQVLTLDS